MMKALRMITDKDLGKVRGGGPGGFNFRTSALAVSKKRVVNPPIVRDPHTSALYPKWQEFGI